MAFFGLTGLGYQDSIKSRLAEKRPATCPVSTGSSEPKPAPLKLPPIPNTGRVTDHFNNYTNPTAGNERSYSKHITLLKKHVRSGYSPNELYRIPLTDANNFGWWIANDGTPPAKTYPWARTARYVHCSSEMTSFVDAMALTNREFSLF
ncbi:sperm microtubule inner protein 11-like [Ciona intestinalis]|uniref:Testis-expressed protein 49-like n=1 Tax=Ciona intestinalis TaxID=7719 RepID=F6SZB5_CIOIN|nr:testis-expressed protein 49-like [Ciona intestinalis]|eukprot:XP_002127741.1 testis-expressed protein 49-like [Ciona intestinalis]